MKMLWIF